MHVRHPQQHVSKQPCPIIQLSSKDEWKEKKNLRTHKMPKKYNKLLTLVCYHSDGLAASPHGELSGIRQGEWRKMSQLRQGERRGRGKGEGGGVSGRGASSRQGWGEGHLQTRQSVEKLRAESSRHGRKEGERVWSNWQTVDVFSWCFPPRPWAWLQKKQTA